jgi:hypothetical protein
MIERHLDPVKIANTLISAKEQGASLPRNELQVLLFFIFKEGLRQDCILFDDLFVVSGRFGPILECIEKAFPEDNIPVSGDVYEPEDEPFLFSVITVTLARMSSGRFSFVIDFAMKLHKSAWARALRSGGDGAVIPREYIMDEVFDEDDILEYLSYVPYILIIVVVIFILNM